MLINNQHRVRKFLQILNLLLLNIILKLSETRYFCFIITVVKQRAALIALQAADSRTSGYYYESESFRHHGAHITVQFSGERLQESTVSSNNG